MNAEVKITKDGKCTEYNYKGLCVDNVTWESAGASMYCGHLTDEDFGCIVRTLYDTLVSVYGEDMIKEYINKPNGFEEWDEIDDLRWREEEGLFLEWGAVYYEDIVCPHCDSDEWEDKGNGVLICNDCGKTFNVA